jgi:translation initiation factor 2 alpha subunit (eIF-2alpha)
MDAPKPKLKKTGKNMSRVEMMAQLAIKYGVAYDVIRKAHAEGVDVYDENAMADRIAKRMPNTISTASGKVGSLADVKIEKLRKETERLQLKIDAEKKRLVPIDQVRRDMVRIANAVRSELMRFAGDVPNWEGLKAAEMQRRVDEKVEAMCTDLADAFGELYK